MSDAKRPCKVRSDVGTGGKKGPFFLLVSILFLYNFYSSCLLITFSNYSVSVPFDKTETQRSCSCDRYHPPTCNYRSFHTPFGIFSDRPFKLSGHGNVLPFVIAGNKVTYQNTVNNANFLKPWLYLR